MLLYRGNSQQHILGILNDKSDDTYSSLNSGIGSEEGGCILDTHQQPTLHIAQILVGIRSLCHHKIIRMTMILPTDLSTGR